MAFQPWTLVSAQPTKDGAAESVEKQVDAKVDAASDAAGKLGKKVGAMAEATKAEAADEAKALKNFVTEHFGKTGSP